MRRPYSLTHKRVSNNTIDALGQLLEEARSGDLIGVALVAMYRGKSFAVATAGEAHRSPTFTRGMVAHLDDSLSTMATRK